MEPQETGTGDTRPRGEAELFPQAVEAPRSGYFARVALPVPLLQLFDYEIPPELRAEAQVGCRLEVPFGNRRRTGYLIERTETTTVESLKQVRRVLDPEPLLSRDLLELLRWVSDYYLAPLGEVIESAVPKRVRSAAPPTVTWCRLLDSEPASETGTGHATRNRILQLLKTQGPQPERDLIASAQCTRAPVLTLEKRGLIERFRAEPRRAAETDFAPSRGSRPELTESQRRVVDALCAAIEASKYSTHLLHGVTGSGKTEVYLHSIAHCLSLGLSALVLVPEISLTPQTVSRFEERFGRVAVLHSLLSPGERARYYDALRRGELRVAIGARSAIFAPIPKLGLIVVDECHEPSYKQESTPRYHARDVAVYRASQLGVPCVLGSATPSLESLENANRGRYEYHSLPDRVTQNPLATIEVVDLQREPQRKRQSGLFSQRLIQLMEETLADDSQILLFLNRRGFARQVLCPVCGFIWRCPDCDIGMTYHRGTARILCHYCAKEERAPDRCPSCESLALRNLGAGTERVEDIVRRRFPDVPLARLDRDTASSSQRLEQILEAFRRGETKILIGTQMVAKGHDIPGVTLVGVLDADVALSLPDFRAAERTYQLLCQVAGRAGRGRRPGRVVIQTRVPDHYAIHAARAQRADTLIDQEREHRQLLAYPPYGYLVHWIFEDEHEERAREVARSYAEAALRLKLAQVLGPAPAPIAKLRGRYRYHLLLKARSRAPVQEASRALLRLRPKHSTTRTIVDIDPQSIV